MPSATMRELLEAGVHFGHQTRRWNPKMRRFIFGERNGIYIIDLQQTSDLLDDAAQYLRNIGERNGSVLFVGTKKQCQDAVETHAGRVGMPYVNHRWLGGLLTNYRTIQDRIRRLNDQERYQAESKHNLLPTRERLSAQAERRQEDSEPYRSEFRYGSLTRLVSLPVKVDAEDVTARYEKGVLEVSVPAREVRPEGTRVAIEKAD